MNSTLKHLVLYACLLHFTAAAANSEDKLRLLIWEGYAPEKYVKKFEEHILKKYNKPVKLEVKHIDGPEDFFGPIRKKSVDLVTLTHHYFKDERFKYISGKLLLPLDKKNIPNLKNVIPELSTASHITVGNNLYAVPVCQGPYGLAYNTGKVKSAPDSWKVLWNKENKGTYVLGANEYIYNVCTAALAWDYSKHDINSYDKLNTPGFKAKLRQLAQGADTFWTGMDTPEDLSGRKMAAVWGDSLGALKKKGEVWKIAEPKEGTLCWVDNYAITWSLKDKPFLKKVAEEWINYLLEPDYQVDYITREITLTPVTTNITDKLNDEEKSRFHIGKANYFKENRILLPVSSRRDRNGLKLLWEEAMKGIKVKKASD